MISSYQVLCAPLQGFTTHEWRSAHARIFGGVHSYYAPFMRIEHGKFLNRDIIDVKPENNHNVPLTPQILACSPGDALKMVQFLKEQGYKDININLGCPFAPIALKHKGSGMLAYPQEVEVLFKELASMPGLTYSVKMRLGWQDADQWRNIFNLMDLITPTHIIVHPRTGKEQYKGNLDLEAFDEMVHESRYPLIYNGNIQSQNDIEQVMHKWPSIQGVMIGRAMVSDPAMLCREKATPDNYRKFYLEIYNHYAATLSGGEHQLLRQMQSFWEMFLPQADRKSRKAIKKATSISAYESAVESLFNTLYANRSFG